KMDECRIRLRIPDRDLRSRSEAHLWVLCVAVPDGGPLRGARRSQGGQEVVDLDRARGVPRGGARCQRGRRRAGRRAWLAGDMAVARVLRDWSEGQPGQAVEARADPTWRTMTTRFALMVFVAL